MHDILNGAEYLNEYLNEYSFNFLNILLNIQSSFLDVSIFIRIFNPFLNILKEYSWLSLKIFIWIAPQHGIFFFMKRYSQRYSSDQIWLSWIFTWIFIFVSEYLTWKRIFLLIFGYSWRPWPVAAVLPLRLLRYAAQQPPFLDLSLCFQQWLAQSQVIYA